MNKLEFYIINAVFSGLIGAIIECAGVVYTKETHVCLFDLLKSIGDGAFIGTIALLFFFHVFVKLKKHPLTAFLSVFVVVALLSVIGDVWYGLDYFIHFIHTKWIIVLIIAETSGLILAYVWYRQILFYNEKLELKKAANRREPKVQ